MSHTTKAKCKIKCSLDVLKRVISNKFPEWETHIKTSNALDLPFYNYGGQKETENNGLVVPGQHHSKKEGVPAAKGLGYADVGFHLVDGDVLSGTWEALKDDYELRGKYANITETVNASIAEEKGNEFVRSGMIPGLKVTDRTENNDEITFRVGGFIDVEDVERTARRMMLA